jgi:hypothetical protein
MDTTCDAHRNCDMEILCAGTYGQAKPKYDYDQPKLPDDEEYYIVDWRNKDGMTALGICAKSFTIKVHLCILAGRNSVWLISPLQ